MCSIRLMVRELMVVMLVLMIMKLFVVNGIVLLKLSNWWKLLVLKSSVFGDSGMSSYSLSKVRLSLVCGIGVISLCFSVEMWVKMCGLIYNV